MKIDREFICSAGRSLRWPSVFSQWTKVRSLTGTPPPPLGPATAPLVRPDFTPYPVPRTCSVSSGQGRVDELVGGAPSRLAGTCASEAAGGEVAVEVGRLAHPRAPRRSL